MTRTGPKTGPDIGPVSPDPVLAALETYYDAAPRASATTEEVGPFTLFLRDAADGWHFYARPRLGLDADITADDVRRARERQRQHGVPEAFEWVHESTPSLLAAARHGGLTVEECPLLVLGDAPGAHAGDDAPGPGHSASAGAVDEDVRVRPVAADDDLLPDVLGAIGAGFRGTDTVAPGRPGVRPRLIAAGLLTVVAALDAAGDVVGGGSHGPRGATTELTGIAVLPRARRRGVGAAITRALVADARERGVDTVFLSAHDDEVARVYERVGFVRVGTACMASVVGAP